MTTALTLLQFALCAVVIAFAGFNLTRCADRLAVAHGWGRGWAGVALLATVTSLPELASGISAVAFVGSPNLAVGNALGACIVNLAFMVVVDLLHRRQPLYAHASPTHLLSAGFGVVMLASVAMSLVMASRAPAVLHVGIYSPLLLAFYLLALRSVHGHERRPDAPATTPAAAPATRARDWRGFLGAALLVLAAGSWLPSLADQLAAQLGLSRSAAGTVFMALVTTLPEMAVTVAALRIGALDMAIGNLLGSNLFNVAILAVDDLFYTRGPLLAHAAPVHAGTAATGLLMTGLVVVGLVMRPQGRVLRVASWVSVGLVAAYAINATLMSLAAD